MLDNAILNPLPELGAVNDVFHSSYQGEPGTNRFTKVKIDAEADQALKEYFAAEAANIESWFNIIAPHKGTISALRHDLKTLADRMATT